MVETSDGMSMYNILIFYMFSCHGISDKSTAQTKVQMQIVEQLENQLSKEQNR